MVLDRLFRVRDELVLITPNTVRRWGKRVSRVGFWLRSRRRRGRPPLPVEIVAVIRKLASENSTWSIGMVARTASTQLGIRVSKNTVKRHLPLNDPRRRKPAREVSERWSTFIRNHSHNLLAMDFAVERTLLGGILYVLVVMETGSRRILHVNVTAHPTAEWTAQQLRDAIAGDHPYKYLIHDNDSHLLEGRRRHHPLLRYQASAHSHPLPSRECTL